MRGLTRRSTETLGVLLIRVGGSLFGYDGSWNLLPNISCTTSRCIESLCLLSELTYLWPSTPFRWRVRNFAVMDISCTDSVHSSATILLPKNPRKRPFYRTGYRPFAHTELRKMALIRSELRANVTCGVLYACIGHVPAIIHRLLMCEPRDRQKCYFEA